MKVELNGVEAETILIALERPAGEPVSPFRAAIRARVKRKMRIVLDEDTAGEGPTLPGVPEGSQS